MKPIDHARTRLTDLVRSLVYPVVPILGVIVVWAYAYAGSLESKLHRDLQPHGDDFYFVEGSVERAGELHRYQRQLTGPRVTSADDQD